MTATTRHRVEVNKKVRKNKQQAQKKERRGREIKEVGREVDKHKERERHKKYA